jgi:hypothetical protein
MGVLKTSPWETIYVTKLKINSNRQFRRTAKEILQGSDDGV